MPEIYNNLTLNDYESRGWIVGSLENHQNGNALNGEIDPDLVIPQEYNNKTILAIGMNAFRNVHLKSISLPDTIEFLSISAFDLCYLEIDCLTLPKDLLEMGWWTFSSNRIKKVKIGSKVKQIGHGAFIDNPTLESIEVDQGNSFFAVINGCLYDINITVLYCLPPLVVNFQFPVTLKEVMPRSIYLPDTKEIWLPTSLTTIDDSSFYRVPNLTKIHILGNIETIGKPFLYQAPKKIEIFYHGQTPVTTEGIIDSTKTEATAYVCMQYDGKSFSNLTTKIYGSCYQLYIYKTLSNCHIRIFLVNHILTAIML